MGGRKTRRNLGSGDKTVVATGQGSLGRIPASFIIVSSRAMDWSHNFEMPIYLPPPERGELRTLLDAAHYMLALPLHTFAKPAWQEAAQAVIGAARNELSLETVWYAVCRALLLERLH